MRVGKDDIIILLQKYIIKRYNINIKNKEGKIKDIINKKKDIMINLVRITLYLVEGRIVDGR